mmetsp:Transcript_34847/g.71880  ORF Transcript_34847/g.71880 Transcript_34847/m.71880 type:complete len:111 (+) Transcript_34847:24-356(+)
MAAKRSGLTAGLNKGHVVAPRDFQKRNSRVGRLHKRVKVVRSVIREMAGLSPYEKKMLDTLKVFGSAADKKLYKFAKRRLGTHKRAVQKREEMKEYQSALRAAEAMAKKK